MSRDCIAWGVISQNRWNRLRITGAFVIISWQRLPPPQQCMLFPGRCLDRSLGFQNA